MKKELEQKLVKRFPVLYQDYTSPMQQTCMCWGFSHGDGWFDIIWQLSLAIEDELGYSKLQEKWFLFKKKFIKYWNSLVYTLSPVHQPEVKWVDGKGMVEVKPAEVTWDEKIARFLFGEKEKIGRFETSRLALKKLAIVNYSTGYAVQQVKEKFGTLRFYAPGNDRIFHLITLAERLSAVTCEVCGNHGTLRTDRGWIQTLCDEHAGVTEKEETTDEESVAE